MGFTETKSVFAVYQVIILQVIILIVQSNGGPVAELQDNYNHVAKTNSSYKIYPIYKSSEDAIKTCALDEAKLFYPTNEHEAEAVLQIFNQTVLYRWLFLNNDTKPEEKIFDNVDALPIWELYNAWHSMEQSNDTLELRNVVVLLNDSQFSKDFPFICKRDFKTENKLSNEVKEVKPLNLKGYTYFNDTDSYYKIVTKFENWKNAKAACAKEGATLFYPENKCECDIILKFWNETQFFRKIFIGISNTENGSFETIDGRSIWDVYSNWNPGEPNNINHEEGCVIMMRNGTLYDEKCILNVPFICKIKANNKENSTCDKYEAGKANTTIRKDYTYVEDTKSFYKIHTVPHKWSDAKEICTEEEASLFFPENEIEAKAVVLHWEQTQPISKAFIGLSRSKEGIFKAIDGRSVNDVYNKWRPNEPNNMGGEEGCVVIFPDATLNDHNCNTEFPFICKKRLGSDMDNSNYNQNVTPQGHLTETQPSAAVPQDYKYLNETQCAYKIHPTYNTWKEANKTCALEGASLFYPINDCEAYKVLEVWNNILIFRWINYGNASTTTKEMFDNIETRPIWELYNNWHSAKQQNDTSDEKKVILLLNEQIVTNFPFVCKKTVGEPEIHITCNNRDKVVKNEYTYINQTERSYKIHTTFRTWKDANETCVRENAALFYPENKCEANAVLDLWNKTHYFRRIFVGISITADESFVTIDGRPDWEVYRSWQRGEPNNDRGVEGCVTIMRNGTMNDDECGLKLPFICVRQAENRTGSALCNKPEEDKTPATNFRKDYTYLEDTHSLYKIHTISRSWQKAKDTCEREGAQFFFPENECEARTVVNFWNETQLLNEIYIGISSSRKGSFLTVDGRFVWDVYYKFGPGEPNNLNNNENCLTLHRHDITYNDDSCYVKHAFICKKKLESQKNNTLCEMSDEAAEIVFRSDYNYVEATDSSYKIHTVAQSWLDAKDICNTEGSTLFVPESDCEVTAVTRFWADTQPFAKVFIGLSSSKRGMFEAVDGRLVSDVDYRTKLGETNNGNHNHACVTIEKETGSFNNDPCHKKHPFICKKKINKLNRTATCQKAEQWTYKEISAEDFKDYTLLEDTNNYYKLHTTLTSWDDAKNTCALEGASFFYPENECEKSAVMNFWNKTSSIPVIYIGVSSPISAGIFESVDGRPIFDIYNKWSPGEPNNADGVEGCVVLRREGNLNDEPCFKNFGFICKKTNTAGDHALSSKVCESKESRTEFFRDDYNYVADVKNFYKIHTSGGNWQFAKKKCTLEGAKLFYPENKAEAEVVLKFWNQTQPFLHIFIGASDLLSKEDFESLDGRPISETYDNWGPGEPNNADDKEDCVVLRSDGTLNDDHCNKKYPFICKKSLASVQRNDRCNTPDNSYIYDEARNKCYKFHMTPKNWTDAYAVCSVEQSYLAVINSEEEAELLVKITEEAPKHKARGNFLLGAVHLGYHNREKKGWKTLKGQSLYFTGYDEWAYQQPDGGDNELCGSMFYNGKLNDIGCSQKCFFICERDI